MDEKLPLCAQIIVTQGTNFNLAQQHANISLKNMAEHNRIPLWLFSTSCFKYYIPISLLYSYAYECLDLALDKRKNKKRGNFA